MLSTAPPTFCLALVRCAVLVRAALLHCEALGRHVKTVCGCEQQLW